MPFPGVERLVATSLSSLPRIPVGIAVAAGATKVPAIAAGAHARYFNQLVTDATTAAAILAYQEDQARLRTTVASAAGRPQAKEGKLVRS